MPSHIFDAIRTGCAEVAQRASAVNIRRERINAYAADLAPTGSFPRPFLEPEHHHLGHGPATVAYILTLDAVNFGSGYFADLRPRDGLTGYFLVATALRDRFRRHGPWSADELCEMSPEQCASLFGQELDHPRRRELMGHFATALRQLGTFVRDEYGGSFVSVVESVEHSAARLVHALLRMPSFRDVATHSGRSVWLLKRAQICVADLYIALEGIGPGRFDDIDDLTIFADNQVPHVLRLDGILEYDSGLRARIERGEFIEAGSREEVEIRACSVHAAELILTALRSTGRHVDALTLDNLLWHRGLERRYRESRPHRTLTVAY